MGRVSMLDSVVIIESLDYANKVRLTYGKIQVTVPREPGPWSSNMHMAKALRELAEVLDDEDTSNDVRRNERHTGTS